MPRGFDRKTAGKGDLPPTALTLVEPYDNAVAIFSLLDSLNDNIGLLKNARTLSFETTANTFYKKA